jgi:hypothetical protein
MAIFTQFLPIAILRLKLPFYKNEENGHISVRQPWIQKINILSLTNFESTFIFWIRGCLHKILPFLTNLQNLPFSKSEENDHISVRQSLISKLTEILPKVKNLIFHCARVEFFHLMNWSPKINKNLSVMHSLSKYIYTKISPAKE